MVKKLILTALNAKAKNSAFASFRDGFSAGHMGKTMTNEQLDRLLRAFVELHPYMANFICADQGIGLMNIDGRIAERVHKHFVLQGVCVLSVHDSFIIDYTRVAELKRVMAEASAAVVGRALEVSQSGAGLDEFRASAPRDQVLDFISWRQVPRETQYLERLQMWEKMKGKQVIPY